MTQIADRTTLITGGASGIGKLTAEKMAGLGSKVIIWDINEIALREVVTGIQNKGGSAYGYRVDLTDKNSIYTVAEQVLEDHGSVDILINNAGIVSGKNILEASDEDIERTFDVNTLALFWTTRAFMPKMQQRKIGHIVTVASAGGIVGTSQLVDYCSSKFAAIGFNESLRNELSRLESEIKTTVVCPFYVNTGMFEGVKSRFSFILPILEPDYVADKMVAAIKSNKQELITPKAVMLTYLLRIFPTKFFDLVTGMLGINKTMDEFVGRETVSDTLKKSKVA